MPVLPSRAFVLLFFVVPGCSMLKLSNGLVFCIILLSWFAGVGNFCACVCYVFSVLFGFILVGLIFQFSCMDVSFVFVCLLTRRLRELVPEQAKSHASTTRLPHRFRYCSNSGFPFLLLLLIIIITLTLTLAIRIPLLFAKSWRQLW